MVYYTWIVLMGSCHVVLSCDKQFEYDNHKTEDLFILIDEFADYHNYMCL